MAKNFSGWLSRLTPARLDPGTRAGTGPLARAPGATARVAGTRGARPARTEAPGLDGAVPPAVRAAAGWSWRLIVIAAACVIVGYVVVTFKTVVVAFLVAILLAVLLEPISTRLRRLRLPRSLASLVTIALTLAAVSGLLTLAGRSIIAGFSDLADQATAGFTELLTWLTEGPLGVDESQIDTWLGELQGQLGENSGVLVSGVLSATNSVTQVVTGALISLFCLFFFLKEGRRIWQWFVRLAPVRARDNINEAGIRGWMTLGGYTRTQILVAFVDAVGIGAGAALLGVPLALPLAILVFLGAFIPIVGALVSGSVAVLVAIVDQGVGTGLVMLIIVLGVQQLEGNLLQPWLQGNALSLHPIAILLAVAAGTGVAGILGALFSVPLIAVINTVVLYLHGHDKYPRLATDWHRPGGPPGILFGAIRDSYAHVAEDSDDDGAATSAATADEIDDDVIPAGADEIDDDVIPAGADDDGAGGLVDPRTGRVDPHTPQL
ncbi:AI-2E family transporter [Georgenia wangjunii]|uniref:AI-2E family transporter n=1 Tax=Georgenia wangjunii TaxID=3117730 RepID=UPI002F25F48F